MVSGFAWDQSNQATRGRWSEGSSAEGRGEWSPMGAGGSTIALTWHLMRRERGADVPSRIIVTDPSQHRLDEIRRIHEQIASDVPVEYIRPENTARNDEAMASLKAHSLVINATGLGKDAPGSPITDAGVFPEDGIVWELNYRGNLVFLEQARRQQAERRLQVEDGWTYFLHGWTQVIAEVFHIEIATGGPQFDEISRIAIEAAKG